MASLATGIPWKTHISAGNEPLHIDSRNSTRPDSIRFDSIRFDLIRLARMPIRLDCVSIGSERDAQRGGELLREIYVESDAID